MADDVKGCLDFGATRSGRVASDLESNATAYVDRDCRSAPECLHSLLDRGWFVDDEQIKELASFLGRDFARLAHYCRRRAYDYCLVRCSD